MHGWQANKERTCAPPVILGLCPKMKNHPLGGWIFISKRIEVYDTYFNSVFIVKECFFGIHCTSFMTRNEDLKSL